MLNLNKQLSNAEFPARSGKEHKEKSRQYLDLPPEKRQEFFSQHGVRWSEFCNLEYFDPIRQSVFDPMHNVLLGEALPAQTGDLAFNIHSKVL